MIDAHCHLYDSKFDDLREEILKNITQTKQICICSADMVENSKKAITLANENPYVYATIGTHPHEVIEFSKNDLDEYRCMAKNKKVVAIGEIGLDYYYDLDTKQTQIDVLKSQIELAISLNLPCVFHVREAIGDFLNVIKDYKEYFLKIPCVMHSFSGSVESAKILLNYNFYLSINGICTFKNAKTILDVIREVPLDRLLIETDAPYLAPTPHRGEINRPEYVLFVAKKIAELKNLDEKTVIQQTDFNTKKVFRIV